METEYRAEITVTLKVSALVNGRNKKHASREIIEWVRENVSPDSMSLDETCDTIKLAKIKVNKIREAE